MRTQWTSARVASLVAIAIALALSGCFADASISEDALGVEWTGDCELDGIGALPAGDSFMGSISDASGTPDGAWSHTTGDGDQLVATPSTLICRVNGAKTADVRGTGEWNGVAGHQYLLSVQDRGAPPEATRELGAPEVRTISATRWYSPSRWDDGEASWVEGAQVTIPEVLPVTVGNAGNHLAFVTFTEHETGQVIRCDYRGSARCSHPWRRDDVDAGLEYRLVQCHVLGEEECGCDDDDDDDGHHGRGRGHHDHGRGHGWGHGHHDHDDDDDDDCVRREPPVAGDVLEVAALSVHVQSGSSRHPSRAAAQTTVTVDFDVTPYVLVSEGEPDFYLLRVWDPSGTFLYEASGDLAMGDLTVTLLP